MYVNIFMDAHLHQIRRLQVYFPKWCFWKAFFHSGVIAQMTKCERHSPSLPALCFYLLGERLLHGVSGHAQYLSPKHFDTLSKFAIFLFLKSFLYYIINAYRTLLQKHINSCYFLFKDFIEGRNCFRREEETRKSIVFNFNFSLTNMFPLGKIKICLFLILHQFLYMCIF